VALPRTDVSEERIASIMRVTRIGELRTALAVNSNRMKTGRNIVNAVPSSPILVTLMTEAIRSSETSVLIIATPNDIPEDGILYSLRSENFRSYIALTG
jgi:hypothetical protein